MKRARNAGWLIVVALSGGMACDGDEPGPLPAWDQRAWRGLEISPVIVDLTGKTPELVALGSYLVNAQGACNDCHTCPSFVPGHDPFKGEMGAVNAPNYLAGGRAFGPVIAPAITPDANGLPAGLTVDEFMRALRTGRDPRNPGDILKVMPWPVYAQMIDGDLRAIYEYLRSIPPAAPGRCD